jgi:serine/threonine-protein phosphatase CPPED1
MASIFHRCRRAERFLFYFTAAGVLLIVGGCGDKQIRRYPVHGSVNVDNKPVEGVMVIFCPVGGPEELQNKRPQGVTGPDGKFQLTTLTKDDGAPAGEYKIIAQWFDKIGTDKFGRPSVDGEDRLKSKYMNLEKSELKATVKEGATDLPPFELKSK